MLRLQRFWWCARKRQHERRSNALGGLNLNPTVHRSHAVFDNGQPQTQAADVCNVVALSCARV